MKVKMRYSFHLNKIYDTTTTSMLPLSPLRSHFCHVYFLNVLIFSYKYFL